MFKMFGKLWNTVSIFIDAASDFAEIAKLHSNSLKETTELELRTDYKNQLKHLESE